MHNEGDMKRKGAEPATKADLDRFATKDDLDRFATKDDLGRFATKDDLGRFATKADLEQFAKKDDMTRFAVETNSRMDEFSTVLRRQSVRIVKLEASMDGLREDVVSVIKGMESRLTERMDSFMSNTLRVDRDNILLVHRLDKVEGRVSNLERRVP